MHSEAKTRVRDPFQHGAGPDHKLSHKEMTIYSRQRPCGCGSSAKNGVSWPLECECGWVGGKLPLASTESQKAERRRAAWPHLRAAGRSTVGESEVGWGEEGEGGCVRPQEIPEVAGKQAFDANGAQ